MKEMPISPDDYAAIADKSEYTPLEMLLLCLLDGHQQEKTLPVTKKRKRSRSLRLLDAVDAISDRGRYWAHEPDSKIAKALLVMVQL
jgi:hypothetical protein